MGMEMIMYGGVSKGESLGHSLRDEPLTLRRFSVVSFRCYIKSLRM